MAARDILAQALTRTDPAERALFLDHACAGDEDLRSQVEALLQAEFATGNRSSSYPKPGVRNCCGDVPLDV